MQISTLVPEIFVFKKGAKYGNQMADEINQILYKVRQKNYLGQFAS